jgi:hypothetical protein
MIKFHLEQQTPQHASAMFLRYVQKHTLTQCYIPEDMSDQSIRTSGSPLLRTCICMVRLKFIFRKFSGLLLCMICTMTYSMLNLPDTAYTIYSTVTHGLLTRKQIKIPHMTSMINLHIQWQHLYQFFQSVPEKQNFCSVQIMFWDTAEKSCICNSEIQ